jgi:hypothetical protein
VDIRGVKEVVEMSAFEWRQCDVALFLFGLT